jgi:hypothetical protein
MYLLCIHPAADSTEMVDLKKSILPGFTNKILNLLRRHYINSFRITNLPSFSDTFENPAFS